MAFLVISQLLRRVYGNIIFMANLSLGSLIACTVQLGKELSNNSQGIRNTNNKDKDYLDLLFQVWSGLLGIDITFEKEVPTPSQSTKGSFAQNSLPTSLFFRYQAVAVTRGSLGLINVTHSRTWLQRLPSFGAFVCQLVNRVKAVVISLRIKTKPDSQTSCFLSRQLFWLSLVTELQFGFLLPEGIYYQQKYLWLTNGLLENYAVKNRPEVVHESWSFTEQNQQVMTEIYLPFYQHPNNLWRFSVKLLPGMLWPQHQTYIHQIHQPGEYKHSNLTAENQPSVCQICLQVDFSVLEGENRKVFWVDNFSSFGRSVIGSHVSHQYYLDNIKQFLELSFINDCIRGELKLILQSFVCKQLGEIVNYIQKHTQDNYQNLGKLILYKHLKLALSIVLSALANANLDLTISPFVRKVSQQIFLAFPRYNSFLRKMIAAINIAQFTGNTLYLHFNWRGYLTHLVALQNQVQRLLSRLLAINRVIYSLEVIAVLWRRATLIIKKKLIIIIIQYLTFLLGSDREIHPILQTFRLLDEFQKIINNILDDVLGLGLGREEDAKQLLLLTFFAQIASGTQFENISLVFHPDRVSNALKNISFNIRAGQTVGIVGASGSGKTTITNLLTGFYHPNSGRIISDGYDVSRVSLESLQKQSRVISREYLLFLGTTFDNITLYNREFTFEQIIVAAKLLGVHSCFIQILFLDSYTLLGEIETILGREQQQKIAIPGALTINSRISVLDELTIFSDTYPVCQLQQNSFCFVDVKLFSKDSISTNLTFTHCSLIVSNAEYILIRCWGYYPETNNLPTINDKGSFFLTH